MSYRALLGALTVLPFLVLAILYTAGSLEAAGQGQNSQNSPPDFGKTKITLSVSENADAGDFGDPITATDADDGDTLRYRIITRPRGPFEIASDTGQLRTTEPLNYEAMSIHQTPSYMLTYYYLYIGVSDGSADDYISVEVKVKDVEEDGVVDLLWDQPQVSTPITASLSDPDGDVSGVTWQWASSTDKSDWTDITTNGTSATYTPVAADNDKHLRATASYTDRRGPEKSANGVSDHQSRAIPQDNTAPTIRGDASVEIEVNENTPAGDHLGGAFQASDTDEIRYFLGGTDGGAFDIDPKTGQLKVKDPLNHESKETYSLSVSARDPTRAGDTSLPTGTVTVTISVTDVNERPKVSGDFKPTYQENSGSLLVTTLTGVDEDDKYGPFHQNSSVNWLIGGYRGSDGDFFYIGDDGNLKFRVPPDFDNPADRNRDNVYDVSITAYTGKYDMTFFNVSVTVTDANDDGVVEGLSSVNYPEGATRPVATYTISDTTQQTISWSVSGTDRDQFTIDGGMLRFESTPDYDSPSDHDRNNKYSITVTAHGTNVTASMNVVVTVTEHNFPPVISGPATPTFAENDTGTVATYSATDEDEDPITWSLAGVDAGDLSIHSSDGTLTFRSPPDFEGPADDDTNNDYDVTVQAHDGTDAVNYPVTVTVTNVNEAPSFDAQTATRTVDENTAADQPIGAAVVATDVDAGDTLTYSLDATSAAVFGIDISNGQLKTKAALDHEDTDSYSVTVTVRDAAGLTATIDVTITVNDVNEPPEFPSTETGARTIPENTQADQPMGGPVQADDPDDGDALTYTLSGTDVASFDIDNTTGQLKTKAALDLESKASYSVTVAVRDNKDAAGNSDTADDDTVTVTITVTQENEAPTFATQTNTREIAENTGARQNIGTPVTATDEDVNDTITYTLEGTDAASFAIIATSGQLQTKANLNHEAKPSYTVTVTATDGQGASDDITVTISVTDANDAPTFNSGLTTTTFEVDENTVAGTNIGTALTATDQDTNDSLTYSLDATSEAVFDIDDSDGQLKTKGPLDYETKPTYTLTVSVSDGEAADSITVTVSVTNLVEDGTITLSSRQPQVGTAFAATLTDPNITSPVATWAWEKSTGKVTWTVISTATTNVYTPVTEDVGSWLKVTATYNDGPGSDKSAQASSELAVRDTPQSNTGPAFADDAVMRQVREDAVIGSNVSLPVTATDADADDSDKLTYTLSGTDVESFDIDAATGQIKTAITLDYDTDNSYTVIVTATDPSLTSDTITVTIAVTRAPRPPSNNGNSGGNSGGGGGGGSPTQRTNSKPGFREGPSTTREVAENTTAGRNIGQPVTATDADNDTLTYSLSGTHAASFGIGPSTGQLKTKDALDYEARASYLVTVTASDGVASSTDATITVTITVTDMNEPPAFGPHTVTRAVSENTVAGTSIGDAFTATDPDVGDILTYSLDTASAAVFDIDTNGQLKTKAPLDYETATGYTITVSVRDSKDAEGTADTATDNSITVTVNVSDLAEDGTITLSSRQPQVGTAFTATLTDPNIASPVATWAWEKSDDKTTWTTISAATTYTYTPLTADVGSYLQVTATYDDGQGVSKSAQALSEFPVRAEPSETNTGPDFDAETADRSIVEGPAAGRNIGQPVTATDANAADEGKLTYTLSGTDGGSFDIVASSGQLLTKGPLVHATKSSYTVTVTATDPFLASATIAVTINVTEYVPPRQSRSTGGGGGGSGSGPPPKPTKPEPEFDANGPVTITVPENTEAGTAIGDPLTATDDDDTVLTYRIIDWRDGSSFDIDSNTGQLKTKAPLDYETRTQYELQANVHDDDGGDDWISINIRVTGVAEAPTVTGDTTIQVAENSGGNLATYTATDPEGLDVTWGLSGDDAGDFSIANGALRFQSTPDHENPADSDGDNVYNVTVEASDGTDTGSLDVTVTVTNLVDDFRVSVSTRGSDTKDGSGGSGLGIEMTSMSYPENSTATVATYAAVEPSGNTITWSAAGDDGSLFSVTEGALSFNSSPDYESPEDSDGNNSYLVKVQASDGTETASLDITINVTNVNEPPSVTGETAFNYAEQSTGSVAAYTASDPEGDELTWSLSGDDSDAFSIAAGALTFANKPNYEEPSDSGADNNYVITVQASDGTYTASLDMSVTVTDIQEVPITNAATQAVGKVHPDSEATITTPDGVGSITFPEESRENSYMVRVDSDPNNCAEDDEEDSTDGSFDGTAEDSDDELRVCLTVHIFDNWGNQEEDVTLDQPASISFKMDADEMGGVEEVLQAYENDGFSIYAQNGENDEWTMVEFVLEADDQGVVSITVSGVSSLGSFAATTNAVVFRQLTATPTPAPPPSLGPSQPRSSPASMVAPKPANRPAPPASVSKAQQSASSSERTPAPSQPAKQPASLSPTLQEFVSDPPLWALILMIVGAVMALTGGGLIAAPPWIRRRLSIIR